METSVNNGMCRCCASEGAFKDVKTTYHWMGEEEIYSDMLRDCFDINLEVSEQGQDGGICEVCITQLRNAINFKKQVLHTEEQFKIHLQNKTMFRPNIVKVELQAGEESDDLGSGDDAFSGPEFEVPIKMETEETKPKKRGAKASATTTRAKKAKTDNGETSNKRVQRNTRLKEDKSKKQETNALVEKAEKQQETAKSSNDLKLILLHSNATLIRNKDSDGYGCNFCMKKFEHPKSLKAHSLEEHSDVQALRMPRSSQHLLKADITDLKCKLCDKNLQKLDDLAEHLKKEHKKNLTSGISEIIPFKFENEGLLCSICGAEYSTFKILQEHMHNHFRNHVCDVCSAGFVTKRLLDSHRRRHGGESQFKCGHCEKEFLCAQKRRDHEQRMHLGIKKRNKCKLCEEKFEDYWTKQNHMVQKHGAPPIALKCTACDRTFNNRRSLTRHVKKDHLMEREHVCTECNARYFLKRHLMEHMIVHTGIKKFECHVCPKRYATKKSLRQHLRSHADDRRFACAVCGLAFVQKCTLKSHMKAKHGE
ncbi:zinc finger protein 69 homolog isoform X10 [Helicoverpa armigera]|uniref:zinc finger protein 69 homolog isoform X10 n=1 Tax=Helicoverpa armigera TaxID=29058 RepID=UPI0030838CB3